MMTSFRLEFVSLALLFSLLLSFHNTVVLGQRGSNDATCSDTRPCAIGCCSEHNQCGFGPDFCGDGCKHGCNSTAECGQFALDEDADCPINTCCSEHGFCGTTEEFCGDGCQPNSLDDGCGFPDRPENPVNTNALSYERRIGYYPLWSAGRGCNAMRPGDLVVSPLTHIYLSFVNFGDDWRLEDEYSDIVSEAAFLKMTNAGLKVVIAIGGWAFNDPPTQNYFSRMASTVPNRTIFIDSCVSFLRKYGLDGVDLDWEYPSAPDRGGHPDDADNYVHLLIEMRRAFDRVNPAWELTAALPTSYWYLRGFDIERMAENLDWINVMSYDIHGMWDQDIEWTGPYLRGHTNLDQIDNALDLFWRNGVRPDQLVFGMAFYGRSFTIAQQGCTEPNGVCQFSTGGVRGTCSGEPGVLFYSEVDARNGSSLDVSTYYDSETTVKYTHYDGDQWVSYDDQQSWHDKKAFLSRRGLSGLMIWALDQDTWEFSAISGLFEDYSLGQMTGGNLDPRGAEVIADAFGAYTGQNCFVTTKCTDGSSGERGSGQVCPRGTSSVDTAHNPLQAPGRELQGGSCDKGWYRHICCPTNAMPKNCDWVGAPERNVFGCSGSCSSSQFQLNQDTYLDAEGDRTCHTGTRKLCCDAAEVLSCFWHDCQGPLGPGDDPECPSDSDYQTYRHDKPSGFGLCSEEYVSPVSGNRGSPHVRSFKSALCCRRSHSNCNWSNNPQEDVRLDEDLICKPQPCGKRQTKVGEAHTPPLTVHEMSGIGQIDCSQVQLDDGIDEKFPYCCDPPSRFIREWPVSPAALWAQRYTEDDDHVLWSYDSHFANNDEDGRPAHPEAEDGSDAYGFVMLNGPEGSLDESFGNTMTVVRARAEIPNVKRKIVTRDQETIDAVWDHAEETFHVYCNYPAGSRECERIFKDGAEDTIIRLPDHVGEGPFARVVSMELAPHIEENLPSHHLEHRSLDGIKNPVYEVKIDYNFHDIKAKREDEPVQIRIDFTNLLDYWEEITEPCRDDDSDCENDRRKRSVVDKKSDWRESVQRASARHRESGRSGQRFNVTQPMHVVESDSDLQRRDGSLGKRWYGEFVEWLRRMTTVVENEEGVLPLGWADSVNLFNMRWGCPGQTASANLRMDLEAELSMDATYAYYYEGSFIPPSTPEMFAYLGMQPTADISLRLQGNARFQTDSNRRLRRKLIDTLAFPSLAVKGVVAVGPTLDVWGEIRGVITLHGEARAGARVTFGKAEVYWPQDDDAAARYEKLSGTDSDGSRGEGISSSFEAGVQLNAQLDVEVTPEANVGIKVGGGAIVNGATLADAQLTAYVKGDLSFQAEGSVTSNSQSFDYDFRIVFFYNLGYKARAQILGLIDWALSPREAYNPDRHITLYQISDSIPLFSKRDLTIEGDPEAHTDNIDEFYDQWFNNTKHNTSPNTPSVFGRQAPDEHDSGSPRNPTFSQPLTCPPGGSGSNRLPELRFNCDQLGGQRVSPASSGNSHWDVTGVCDGIKTATNRRNVYTFAGNNADGLYAERRRQQCPSGFCTPAMTALRAATGHGSTAYQLECDEFPWAAVEEGGNFLPSNARSQTCTKTHKNKASGMCMQILSNMQSNWGRMEPGLAPDDRFDAWQLWASSNGNWNDPDAEVSSGGNTASNGIVPYPEAQPPLEGQQSRTNNHHSYKYKRNFTFSLIDDSAGSDKWWSATDSDASWSSPRAGSPDLDSIICAVNIFGQTDLYRTPFNGFCYRPGTSYTQWGWSDNMRFSRCVIEFTSGDGGNGGSTKRNLGTYGGWEVKNIQYANDPEDDIIIEFPHEDRDRNDSLVVDDDEEEMEEETSLSDLLARVDLGEDTRRDTGSHYRDE